MSSLLSLGIAWLLGYCGVRLWLPVESAMPRWTIALHAALGIGLGAGFTSTLYWLLVVAGGGTLTVVLGVELVLLAVLAALVRRQRSTAAANGAAMPSPSFPTWLPGLGFALMLGILAAAFVSVSELNPQGGWDAFAIWNLRARFLLHTETWRYAVTTLPVGTHMEYPLLLSSLVARGWIYAGSVAPLVPIAIALVFAIALAILLVSALSLMRGAAIGLLAGMVLLSNPSLLNQAAAQYADVPLAFYFLAALVLIVLGGEAARPARYLSLAGAFAGFAAWTKNEGEMLAVALAAALFFGTWRSAGWRSAARRCAVFLAGALPGLLLVLWFKLALAPPDPLAGQLTVNLAHTLANPGRWLQVAGGFLKVAWDFYCFPAPPLVLLAVTSVLLRPAPLHRRSVTPWLAVLLALAGYFAIFLQSKYDLDWLFGTALERLYLHVWPTLVLAVFLLLRRPEDFAIITSPVKPQKAR